jgi:hypothetical protein
MKGLGFSKAVSSRSESRNKDNAGIDICNTDPLQIQCKLTKQLPDLSIFKRMSSYCEEAINLIVWGRTKRAAKNMVKDGDFVIMPLDDFIELINRTREGEI